ncbi:MAG: hypothetical protein WD607_05315 [Candidatus Paceibacterota bacterium]
MFKKILLIFLLFLAFALVGVIYTIIVTTDFVSENEVESDFQGPPAGEIPSFNGPNEQPPSL